MTNIRLRSCGYEPIRYPTRRTVLTFSTSAATTKPERDIGQVLACFHGTRLQEYEERKESGWGRTKGMFTESEFWEWLVDARPEVIKEMLQESEQ